MSIQQMFYIQNELFQSLLFLFIKTAGIDYDCFFSVVP